MWFDIGQQEKTLANLKSCYFTFKYIDDVPQVSTHIVCVAVA